jgi:hypothetical protein
MGFSCSFFLMQFITLIGDSAIQTPSTFSHLRASMRTFRRTWSKGIEYTWISPAADVDLQGDTIRDTLAAVVQLAKKRCVVPHVSGNVSADGAIASIEYEPYQRRAPGTETSEDVIPIFGLTRKKFIEPFGWADDLTGVIASVGQGAEYDSFLGHNRRQTWAGVGNNNKTTNLPLATELEFTPAPPSVSVSASASASSPDSSDVDGTSPTSPPPPQPTSTKRVRLADDDSMTPTPTGVLGPAGTATHSVDTEGLVFMFERAADAFTFNLRTEKRLLDGGCTAVVRLLD